MTASALTAFSLATAALPAAADVAQVRPDDLAARGVPYVLAVIVIAFAWVIVRLYARMEQADRERRAESSEREAELREIIRRQTEALIAVKDSIAENTRVLQKCHDRSVGGPA